VDPLVEEGGDHDHGRGREDQLLARRT
jgi:hypothetical protein